MVTVLCVEVVVAWCGWFSSRVRRFITKVGCGRAVVLFSVLSRNVRGTTFERPENSKKSRGRVCSTGRLSLLKGDLIYGHAGRRAQPKCVNLPQGLPPYDAAAGGVKAHESTAREQVLKKFPVEFVRCSIPNFCRTVHEKTPRGGLRGQRPPQCHARWKCGGLLGILWHPHNNYSSGFKTFCAGITGSLG